ncbi:MAG: AI-2E family transporter [Gammaproteobacteria bacterium]|uniref:AI-2E family transporter n=1 Tax=Rhodoferax sp. TaxID=50421 RepID=UPI001D403EB8|nr:AI-2E family transporter [Rhodoferax sp.]MBU3898398.1 AI-2E family transporter [Gammaproteobacteria bacterium]MBU3998117.1 AI-2E family transporter [Gammaproteobacteria bacterium]MBU4079172.1 AI-2E family transporter [Gammaproteobacteria bacterium]MBU4113763.1 AI-2E family transporter [Gammaproteobacteria bacterium]MBU4171100.1 AI-2E family transporter [Gammaproteobacteria bacterium]
METTSTPPGDAGAEPSSGAATTAELSRVLLHMPVDVRSLSLVVLATLASVFMLRWASAVFIPVMVGLLFSYGLSPVVDWLAHRRIPRALSAAVLVLGIVAGVGGTVYSLSDDAAELVESLPVAAQKLRYSIRALQGKEDNTLVTMQKAASQLEQAAEESNRAAPVQRGVQRVQIEKPKFAINDYLWSGTMGLLAMLGQVGIVALITFFLMASGDTFRRKLVKLAGPTLSRKKVTLQALNEINDQIQRYMLVQLFTSAVVGVATWLCLLAVGLEQAAVWGVAAGVLNLVPYIGNVIVTAGSAMVGFMQFGTLEMALLVAGISLVINSIEGFLLTPWLTSRASKMNPVAIFVGVLAWGWLWGPWGLLLGVPILMVIKAICDRVEDLKSVGEFLGA